MIDLLSCQINKDLIKSAADGDLEGVVRLLAAGADPLYENSGALRSAATCGHAECVELLIPVSDPNAGPAAFHALGEAAGNGHAECVKLLIPCSFPRSMHSGALRWAARNGHAECVAVLLPVSDANALDSQALLVAIRNGHVECVKLLLPVSPSLSIHPAPFHAAVDQGHAAIVELMVESEPALVDAVEAWWLAINAVRNGRADIAFILRSAIEKRSLSEATQKPLLAEASAKRL